MLAKKRPPTSLCKAAGSHGNEPRPRATSTDSPGPGHKERKYPRNHRISHLTHTDAEELTISALRHHSHEKRSYATSNTYFGATFQVLSQSDSESAPNSPNPWPQSHSQRLTHPHIYLTKTTSQLTITKDTDTPLFAQITAAHPRFRQDTQENKGS